MEPTSLTLLERLRSSDDQTAWRRFDALYSPLLLRFARCAGLNDADAADAVQDVLALLSQEMPRFRYDTERRNFRGWLRTVTLNKCRERFRRRATRPEAAGGQSGFSQIEQSEAESLFEGAEYRQYLVARAMEIMKTDFEPTTWQACWEHVVSGRTAAEIASDLGMTEAAVYVAKSRVLRRLREELTGLLE